MNDPRLAPGVAACGAEALLDLKLAAGICGGDYIGAR
jgi:hypothetical protein